MTTDTLTARVMEIIADNPEVDLYHALDMARLETRAEASAARLAWAAFVCVPVIILVVVWGVL